MSLHERVTVMIIPAAGKLHFTRKGLGRHVSEASGRKKSGRGDTSPAEPAACSVPSESPPFSHPAVDRDGDCNAGGMGYFERDEMMGLELANVRALW